MINSKLPFLLDSELDSSEERYYAWYLSDLCDAGYIKGVIPQPEPFKLSERMSHTYSKQLKTKLQIKEETVIRESIYTTDFYILWDAKALGVFITTLESDDKIMKGMKPTLDIAHKSDSGDYYSYTEVKPVFDQNNMTRLARTNIKWVWANYKQFINLAIVPKMFKDSFTPDRYLYQDKQVKNKRKLNYTPITLEEYVKR